jgi:hypothetical protein
MAKDETYYTELWILIEKNLHNRTQESKLCSQSSRPRFISQTKRICARRAYLRFRQSRSKGCQSDYITFWNLATGPPRTSMKMNIIVCNWKGWGLYWGKFVIFCSECSELVIIIWNLMESLETKWKYKNNRIRFIHFSDGNTIWNWTFFPSNIRRCENLSIWIQIRTYYKCFIPINCN